MFSGKLIHNLVALNLSDLIFNLFLVIIFYEYLSNRFSVFMTLFSFGLPVLLIEFCSYGFAVFWVLTFLLCWPIGLVVLLLRRGYTSLAVGEILTDLANASETNSEFYYCLLSFPLVTANLIVKCFNYPEYGPYLL